ncbi:hypothetical protein R3W88_018912 [Solanum pinnatisectum]|uniref:F-box associated beta-propeller type 1 domain-containing protein n=1 Tax=Solanum pinnatisectum TaxID=50273 RepID=A0AAV9KHT9_9SOLN|nr:hypothetical protein R3W88_018912 [Solanum pinnatisectum]
MYFDPITEKFDIFFVLEQNSDQLEDIILGLGVLNECLCMNRYDKGNIELLAMKEYGVKESWTSLFIIRNLHFDYGLILPLFMTKNGELILIIRNNLEKNVVFIYNPRNDNIQDIHVDGRKEYISFNFCYVESLIETIS